MSRNINFDIIRIMAAAYVFCVHLGQFTGIPRNAQNGFYGVWLFYILSGYLIYKSIDSGALKGDNLATYYKKRIVRIVPLYYSVLVVIWIYELLKGILLEKTPVLELLSYNGICGVKFLRYFVFAQMITPTNNYDLWNNRYALWTMSCFAVFYIVAPLIKKISDSFVKSLIVLAIFFEIKVYLPDAIRNYLGTLNKVDIQSFPEFNPLCMMYLFWIGVCAYYAVKEQKQLIYAVLLIVSFSFYIFRGNEYDVMFALVILIAEFFEVNVSEKWAGIIALISKCSFPLYLTHIICFDVLTRGFSFIGYQNQIIKAIVMTAVAFVVAYLTYRVVTPLESKVKSALISDKLKIERN